MSEDDRTVESRRPQDLGRFITFLDAVVAIALTLLVLPLVDITVDARADQPVTGLLADNLGLLGSFLLSFVVIIQLWGAHHRLFERVARYDTVLRLASLAWVFTIVVLPFPTRLVAVYGNDRATIALYIGVLLASSAALGVMTVHLGRHPELWVPGQHREDFESTTWVTVRLVVTTAALVLGVAVPAIGYAALLLLVLAPPAARRLDARRAR